MNVVDSSAWLEYMAAGPNARFFAKPIENARELVVPSITLYEVYKRIVGQRDENSALQAVAAMRQGAVVDLDATLAVAAARIGLEYKLPLADSVILATARSCGAVLWTQDADFESIPGVQFARAGGGG